jgi:hypothetical protein
MPSNAPTIIQEYIIAAIKRALVVADEDDGGTTCCYVPEIPGIRAYGRDVHECISELYRLIDMGIPVWLAHGHELPVLDGIDLNSERGKVLATYHRSTPPDGQDRRYYPDEAALDEAFRCHMRTA